ncbi:hypothetical protein HOLleu_21351 [Holothuria leucospilota]|uniref:G-protein coupled receptors family 1 profile domain-containing protein n=1 Tax=Holothuria leucospilota TaxID=206669 RepID=A0A9Q1BXP4_HOLLE|nr:hypothetical protein HOLleu_21351 [Holothuria leucospilota]
MTRNCFIFFRLTAHYGICCIFDNNHTNCSAPPSPFNTCSLVSNLAVIVSRVISKIPAMRNMFPSTVNEKQNTFLMSLAAADFLMGVYLLAIGIADVKFGENYALFSVGWREGIQCKIIGFTGFVSNIACLLSLTFVTIERFFTVVFPYGKYHFSTKLIAFICTAIWIISIGMALTPIILSKYFGGIYGFSDVCLGLPFVSVPETVDVFTVKYSEWHGRILSVKESSDITDLQWVYSQIVYIYFSSTCASIITLCYVIMFISIKANTLRSGRQRVRKEEIKMTIKMSIIVGTDLLCWLPIIIAGILFQAGVNISVDIYAWLVVFVMPINSAFNPFIYTIPTMKKKRNEPPGTAERRQKSTSGSTAL